MTNNEILTWFNENRETIDNDTLNKIAQAHNQPITGNIIQKRSRIGSILEVLAHANPDGTALWSPDGQTNTPARRRITRTHVPTPRPVTIIEEPAPQPQPEVPQPEPLVIKTRRIPMITVKPYSFIAEASGGSGVYEWEADRLPKNLRINAETGEIYGTFVPSSRDQRRGNSWSEVITLHVTDLDNDNTLTNHTERDFNVEIDPQPAPAPDSNRRERRTHRHDNDNNLIGTILGAVAAVAIVAIAVVALIALVLWAKNELDDNTADAAAPPIQVTATRVPVATATPSANPPAAAPTPLPISDTLTDLKNFAVKTFGVTGQTSSNVDAWTRPFETARGGWQFDSPGRAQSKITVPAGYRLDVPGHSCAEKDGEGGFLGPVTKTSSIATVWAVDNESVCPAGSPGAGKPNVRP